MPQDQEMNLLQLMGVDATAVRANHTFNLLEGWVNAQKRFKLDSVFAFVSGLTAITGFLRILQVPESLPVVIIVSAIFIAIVGILWWRRRHMSFWEALRTMRRFGVYLDQMRRFDRQLELAKGLKGAKTDLNAIRNMIRRSLKSSTDGLLSLRGDMSPTDYDTLSEEEESVWGEITSIRQRYGFGAN